MARALMTRPSVNLALVLYILTSLPLLLAVLAFCLQGTAGPHHTACAVDCSQIKIPSPCGVIPRAGGEEFVSSPDRPIRQIDAASQTLRISIISTTSGGLEQVVPWLFYHRAIGVTDFFLFAEGQAASAHGTAVLSSIPGVQVVPRTKELDELQRNSRIWKESWLEKFFYRPCNHELFVKQNLNMEMGIEMAKKAGVEWIIHLDTDELLHPAGSDNYTVTSLLAGIPPDIDQVVWHNFEAAVERDDVVEPFTEVTLFKKVQKEPAGIPRQTALAASHNNPTYFLTYMNGKAAARVVDGLRPNGAHRWASYLKKLKDFELPESVVLHFSYTKFSDLTTRKDRCRCKPTRKEVKRCIMLPFDRDAFIMASTSTPEELRRWYNEHVVWGDKKIIAELLRVGLFTRIHTPHMLIQGLRNAGIFRDAIKADLPDTTF